MPYALPVSDNVDDHDNDQNDAEAEKVAVYPAHATRRRKEEQRQNLEEPEATEQNETPRNAWVGLRQPFSFWRLGFAVPSTRSTFTTQILTIVFEAYSQASPPLLSLFSDPFCPILTL